MNKRSLTTDVIISVAISVVIVVPVLSRVTTKVKWGSVISNREWNIQVQNSNKAPLPDSYMTVLHEESNITFRAASSPTEEILFDNYSATEKIYADDIGTIQLINPRPVRYEGCYWKLLWIWEIGLDCQESRAAYQVLKISAPGYKAETVSLDHLVSESTITVELEPID